MLLHLRVFDCNHGSERFVVYVVSRPINALLALGKSRAVLVRGIGLDQSSVRKRIFSLGVALLINWLHAAHTTPSTKRR